MHRRHQLAFTLVAVLGLAIGLAGCGRVAPTSPDVSLDPSPASAPAAPAAAVPAPAPVLQPVRIIVQPLAGLVGGTLRLVQNVVKLVLPGVETTVHTSRWSLQFHSASLSQPRLISISQASDGSLRAEFGPDGTQFGQPVDVTVSYAGTSLDPASRSYVRGSEPVFLWLDPATGRWVEMPSVNDPETRTIRAKLHHFSTYGVGGRAGW